VFAREQPPRLRQRHHTFQERGGERPYLRTEGTLAAPVQVGETFQPTGGLDFSFEIDLWSACRLG